MNYKSLFFALIFSFISFYAGAQKPFAEGVLSYKVRLESKDHNVYNGTYTFVFKGNQVRKELTIENGFRDVLLVNTDNNTIYSLQAAAGLHYAVELNMEDIHKRMQAYDGFTITNETATDQKVAGFNAVKGDVKYKDGTGTPILFTREYYPVVPMTFDRFPAADFLPLQFSYTDERGITMQFDMDKLDPSPVENSMFRIPRDYKMISYKEYKELTR